MSASEAALSAWRGPSSVDYRRLVARGFLVSAVALGLVQLWLQARGGHYGYDFRGGIWGAGRAVLSGVSPFPAARPHALLLHPNGFVNPPPLALLGALFAKLPFPAAIILFNLACVAGLLLALRLAGVRDRPVVLLCACSFPFISSLALGQPDGLLTLAAAAAWRYRGSWPGALAGGTLIAAKLLAWPLIVWLLLTRRFRAAALTASLALAILAASWAALGFRGLLTYPRLLAADAHAFETRAHSIFTALARSGVPNGAATGLTVLGAGLLAAGIVAAARGSDLGLFTAALALGIFVSPVVWQHYFVLFLVPLALSGRARDPLSWLLLIALWVSPSETPATLVQAWAVPLLAGGLAVRIAALVRAPVAPDERLGQGSDLAPPL